jgi:gliding motility-associated-like protein
MKPNLLTHFKSILIVSMLLGAAQTSAQIAMRAPEPTSGSGWAACAGLDNGSGPFNEYYAVISWAGSPNADNEFVLEISDANGDFTNAVEVARVGDQNNDPDKEFNIQFAIPTDTKGDNYKLRAKSTSPADFEDSVDSYNMYYMNVTTNLNISEIGDGNPPGDICSGDPITLQVDNIANPETYRYLWYRSGTELSEKGHILNVTQSGIYQAYIDYGVICTGSANTDSNLVMVTIGGTGPGVGITPPSKTALCVGDTELLSVDTTDPSWSYQWYKDGNAIAGATATTYNVDANNSGFEGEYQVEISGSGVCTERSAAVTMTNADNFTVTRDNLSNIVVLPTFPETLSVSTNAVAPTYQWYRNGNIISGATNSTFDVTQDGDYYAAVTQAGGTCPGTTKNSETTIAVVPASFEIIIEYDPPYTACVNTSTVLGVTTINAVDGGSSRTDVTTQLESAFAYQWQLDGADVVGATNQSISLTDVVENGSYVVNATLDSYNESSNPLPVQLLTSETIVIESTSLIYCNSSDTVTLSTQTDISSETFRWELNGASINTNSTSLNITQPGTYRLVLDKNGCDLISNEIEITSLDPNLISLDVDGDVIFPEGSSKTVRASGGTSYQWFDSDNTLMGSSDSMTFTEEGTYLLIANIDNCEVSKTINTSYLDLFNIPNVITPNGDGANDQWVIPNSYSNKQDVRVIIYNENGKEFFNETNYQNSWPESSMSFPAQNMVFYYVIRNDSEILKQGTITVIR